METSLVTGGAGFIGSHVCRALLKMGHQVIILDDLSGGFKENIPSNATFVEGSVTDHKLLENLFNNYDFDYIYHLAAYAAEGLSHFIKRFNYNNNLIGSVNLINEAVKHEIKCFVFTSSIAVYGEQTPPMIEEMTPQPEDSYGIAKYAVEQELKVTKQMFGLDYVIFRPHNVYGEYQNIGDKYRNVVGIFINQLMQNKPLTVFGDGRQTRAFSYIGDVAPAIAQSVHVEQALNEVINIGADKEYTVNELAQAVIDVMGIDNDIRYLDARNEVKHAFADHSKAADIFDMSTYFPLKEGLGRMVDWAKETGAKKSKKFEEIEIDKNLPPIWKEG